MAKKIIEHINHANSINDYWKKVEYLKNFKKQLIKYALKEPFIVEEVLKNAPIEIRQMVWSGYNKSIKKAIKIEFDIKPKTKVPTRRKTKRTNLLYELIDKADLKLNEETGQKPAQWIVFRYIKNNYDELDGHACIQEVKELTIYWKTHTGVEKSMHYKSFCKTLSNLRKKRKLPLPK